MPETRGLPEPEEERIQKVERLAAEIIAGQGIVRRVVLYGLAGGLAVSPFAPLAVLPLILLLATDRSLT